MGGGGRLLGRAKEVLGVTARNFVRRQGFEVSKPRPDSDYVVGFAHILAKHYLELDNFYFVQIGAHDGVSFDDLYEFVTNNSASGLVVEPVKDYFNELVRNYRDYPQIKPVHAALHPSLKQVPIYRLDPKREHEVAGWVRGIASFDPNHHKKSRTRSDVIVREMVSCITWQDLVCSYDIRKVDLLQIDTEGFDFEILKMVDWSKIKPRLVRYEHESLSEEDRKCAMSLLRGFGYRLWFGRQDTVAVLN